MNLRRPGSASLPFYGNTRCQSWATVTPRPLRAGTGVLRVRSPMLLRRVLGRPGNGGRLPATNFVTSDLARIGDDGYLYHILSRADDTIITAGLNIHRARSRTCCFDTRTSRVQGSSRRRAPRQGDPGSCRAQTAPPLDLRRLPPTWPEAPGTRPNAPGASEVVAALPKTPAGKLDRRALRDPSAIAPSRRRHRSPAPRPLVSSPPSIRRAPNAMSLRTS